MTTKRRDAPRVTTERFLTLADGVQVVSGSIWCRRDDLQVRDADVCVTQSSGTNR